MIYLKSFGFLEELSVEVTKYNFSKYLFWVDFETLVKVSITH